MKAINLFLCLLSLVTSLANADSAQKLHNYLWANYTQFAGDYTRSQQWYEKVNSKDASPYHYKGYIPFLFETNRFREIVSLMPTVDAQFKDDVEIQQLIAMSLQKVGKVDESDARFIRLNNLYKTDQTIAFQTANIYMRRKEPENAIATIDNLLNSSVKKPNNFIFLFLKSQIYVQLNNKEKALESVRACLEAQPRFDKGWLLLALLEEQAGRLQEAIKGYSTYLEAVGGNQEIEQHLLQLVFKLKMAQQHNNSIVVSQSCLGQALTLFEQQDYTGALSQIDRCLAQNPTDPENRLLKVQIMSAMNNHAQAADLIKSWILENPTNPVWFETLHLLCKTGLSMQKAIAVLENISKEKPDALLPIVHLADLNTRSQRVETALQYHTKALSLTTDARLKTKIHYQMGLLYHGQRNSAKMEKALEEGYKLGLDFPPLLNVLAYHYAQHDKNLDVADKMMKKALQKNNNNPHFLETKALILYKQKQYDQALELLNTIALQEPQDFAILCSLGKTHYKVGNIKEAINTLERARNQATDAIDKEQCTSLLKEWSRSLR